MDILECFIIEHLGAGDETVLYHFLEDLCMEKLYRKLVRGIIIRIHLTQGITYLNKKE